MSQKDGKFQSKSKKFGAKPGGKSGGKPGSKFGAPKGRAGGKPAGRSGSGFGKRFEGDRPARRDSDSDGYRARKPYGDRKPRRDSDSFGERRPRRDDDRGGKSFGERRPRRDNDSFGERRPRRDGDGEGFRERKSFGDRPPRRDGDSRGGKPFGDRKPRRDDSRGGKSFGDRKPRRDGDSRGGKSFSSREDRTPRYERFDDAPREASEDTRRKLKSDRPGFGAPSPLFLFGHHAVRAALVSEERQIRRLLVTESGFENIREAYDEARAAGLLRPEPSIVEKEDIDRLLPRDAVHQDVLLDVEPLEDVFLQDLLIAASDNARVIILDQVTDPHNVGAILRSAAFFGADAVIVQKLHAPDVTGTLAKAASGAVEFVPIVREVNLARAIEQLKEAFFTCIGLDERGTLTMAQAAKQSGKGRVAIVMGAEGDGLRRLVAEKCDVLAQLPTEGPLESLNVSNATAVALYELARETE